MEIKINNTALDTTLENEKYLGEVVDAVKRWLAESNMQIKEILQDGKHLPMDETGRWWNTHISDIDKLDFVALTNFEKYTEDLQIVYQYVTMLGKAVHSRNFILASDLATDSAIIGETLDYFFPKQNNPEPFSIQLSRLIQNSRIKDAQDTPENTPLIEFLTKVSFLLQQRINEVTDPVGVLKAASEAFSGIIADITNVSVLLQTGKDKEALDAVLSFVELSEKIIRLSSFIRETQTIDLDSIKVEGITFSSFFDAFNRILKELAEAFETSDTVLIGDLLEYEVVPKIDTLLKYISIIEHDKE